MHFMHSNHLGREFSFAHYLRKCKQHVFLKLAGLHSTCWVFLIAVLSIDMFQRKVFYTGESRYSEDYLRTLFTVIAIVLSVVPIVVYFKTKYIMRKIADSSDLLDFDPLKSRFFYKHWDSDTDVSQPTLKRSLSFVDADAKFHELKLKQERIGVHVPQRFKVSNWGELDNSEQQRHRMEKQLELFWFRSHTFIIYLLQSVLLLFVFHFSIVFQFRSTFFAFSDAWESISTLLRLLPFPLFMFFIPATIPSTYFPSKFPFPPCAHPYLSAL